jgi:MOSC domain-containing protein YiiM
MARIVSINTSPSKGTFKYPVAEATLQVDHGIVGDAHSGPWHRQISLLAKESIERMIQAGAGELLPGMFAENITTEGIELFTLPVGARLRLGECLVEVTQIGKQCHQHCEIYHKVGRCVMPTEGIFVKVLGGGTLCLGDEIRGMDG